MIESIHFIKIGKMDSKPLLLYVLLRKVYRALSLFIQGEFPFVYCIVNNPLDFPNDYRKARALAMLLARQIHHCNWTKTTRGAGLGL